MKITQKKGSFEPIQIVLETEEEAKALQTVVGNIVGDGFISSEISIRMITANIFRQLDNLNIETYESMVLEHMRLK